jgi:predicted DNA-binding transcriptional regulator YafY
MSRRKITLRLTEEEAEALMSATNAGIADLIDAQTEEDDAKQEIASKVLNRLGAAMAEAWPE